MARHGGGRRRRHHDSRAVGAVMKWAIAMGHRGTVKLRLAAVFDAQYGGFATGWSQASWGSIDELFVNLTMPADDTQGGGRTRHTDGG